MAEEQQREARLDNIIERAERTQHEPPCRDCEVGEPHMCPLSLPSEQSGGR